MYTVHLAKEPFKFSCSHFTILGPREAERLHGHNYRVRVSISVERTDPELGFAFDFNAVKPFIKQLCDELDERILLPERSAYLKLSEKDGEVEVRFHDRRYVFPADETLRLPLVNVTAEELSRHLGESLAAKMKAVPHWTALRLSVEETHGQSVSYRLSR